MTRSVLIVEDDDLHRSFLRESVEDSGLGEIEIVEADCGEAAIALVDRRRFEHVVVDLQMPGKTGVDVARAVWSKDPTTAILVWSNYADEAYVRGIRRVAPPDASYGYLLKSASGLALRRALQGVFLDGQTIIDRSVVLSRPEVAARRELTGSEYEVLVDVALGLTDTAIAEHRNMSVRSVQGRLQSIYAKLRVGDGPALPGGGLAINRRARAVALALSARKINSKILDMAERELRARGMGRYLD